MNKGFTGTYCIHNLKPNTMAFDIEMIKKVYGQMAHRIDAARSVVGKPLTL